MHQGVQTSMAIDGTRNRIYDIGFTRGVPMK